jgi:hypothetical protein
MTGRKNGPRRFLAFPDTDLAIGVPQMHDPVQYLNAQLGIWCFVSECDHKPISLSCRAAYSYKVIVEIPIDPIQDIGVAFLAQPNQKVFERLRHTNKPLISGSRKSRRLVDIWGSGLQAVSPEIVLALTS